MASREEKPQILNGGSLDGTHIEYLIQSTCYRVVCGIEVENWARWELEDPVIIIDTGCINIPPRTIHPGQREVVIKRKTGGAATGTYGSLSWLIRVPGGDRRVVVMWSAPFNFDYYSNYLAIGITEPKNTEYSKTWAKQMYNNDIISGLRFVKEEYYCLSREIKLEDNDVTVYGGMGTTHKTRVHIVVKPTKKENYAPGIVQSAK